MPEMHLRHPGFTYSACGALKILKKRMIWLMEMGDLHRRTIADKVLRDKAFNIAKNPKYDG